MANEVECKTDCAAESEHLTTVGTRNNKLDCPKISLGDAVPQIGASCVVDLIVIQAGLTMAFSSILIPQLTETESDIKIDLDSSSNLASIAIISISVGSLFCGSLMDRFGRVRLAIFICVPFTIAWLMIGLSRHLYMIYAARALSGFCSGSLFSDRDCKLLKVIRNTFWTTLRRAEYLRSDGEFSPLTDL